MVLRATVDDSGKRQEDIVVRFLEIIVAVFHNGERNVRLGTITRVVSVLVILEMTYFELSPSL